MKKYFIFVFIADEIKQTWMISKILMILETIIESSDQRFLNISGYVGSLLIEVLCNQPHNEYTTTTLVVLGTSYISAREEHLTFIRLLLFQ